MTRVEEIENQINNFLLRNVIFYIDGGKVLKRGKLILFRFKEFYFNFTLENDKGEFKIYEIPYPFETTSGDRYLNFSYNLDNFTLLGSNLYYKAKTMNKSTANKLYDSTLVLSAV